MRIPAKIVVLALLWLVGMQPLQAETVTLNLKDADISALISTVAEVADKNFIVDPRVKGKVTVVSSRPMDSDEVYQVFLSILKVHGFAAVPTGEVIKIIPDVNAKQDSIPTTTDKDPGVGDEMVTRVIQVDNVAAAQLVPILRPLVPQQGHLAAYPATNVLIISDRANNVERLVSIIRRIDQVSDSEIEVIPLAHASASEVVRVLTTLTRASGAAKTAGGGSEQVLVADERTNSVLLGGERSDRLRLRAIISHLDTPLDKGGNTDVVYLRYADAKELVNVLMGVGKLEEQEATAGKAVAAARGSFDIQADESTNALVITAPPDIMRTLRRVISQLDIRKAQVLVEAVIAEVSKDLTRQLGVQWIFADPSGNETPIGVLSFDNAGVEIGTIANAVAGLVDGGGSVPSVGQNALLGFGDIRRNQFSYAALLNALASDDDTNILSTPTLVTLDNEEAEILIGENVPFRTGSFTTTAGTNTNPFTTISREDVGLKLRIKPKINEGDAMKLDIEQEVSNVTAIDVDGPTTSKRAIKTSVMVDDNQVVVLGGLIDETVTEGVQKVPLLGDIPLLGLLFKSKNTTVLRNNLMVFIHPVILRDSRTAAQYTNSKYNYLRELQRMRDAEGVNLVPGKAHPVLPEIGEFGAAPASPAPAPAATADEPQDDATSLFPTNE